MPTRGLAVLIGWSLLALGACSEDSAGGTGPGGADGAGGSDLDPGADPAQDADRFAAEDLGPGPDQTPTTGDGGRDASPTPDGDPPDRGPPDRGAPPDGGPAAGERVLPTGQPCARAPRDATACEQLEITCGGAPARTLELLTYAATAPARGAILFGSGTTGEGYYNFRGREALQRAGWSVLERRWVGGWFEGSTEGPAQAACGLAALIRHLRAALPPDHALCATGNSGGSVELGYALTWLGAGAALDFALPTSGPFHRLDLACQGDADDAWGAECLARIQAGCPDCAAAACEVGGPRRHLDASYGGAPRCTAPGPDDLDRLRADSPTQGPDAPALGGVPALILIGAQDDGAYFPLADALVEHLADRGAAIELQVVAGAGHDLDTTPPGEQAIRQALLTRCVRRAP